MPLPLNGNMTPDASCPSDSDSETGWADINPFDDAAEKLKILSLVDGEEFDNPLAMLEHCRQKAAFDFLELKERLGLGFEGAIRLVNFGEFYIHSSCSFVDFLRLALLFPF